MTKQKSIKRALLMSALSLLACVSMLVGSTFAWFTDSVASKGNKIQSGNLDIQLLMADNTGNYNDISNSAKPIFGAGSIAQDVNGETLWEPGKTQVAYLAIKNNGNLALKYKVALDVENVSKDLYKVMEYAVIADAKHASVKEWTVGNTVTKGVQTVTADVSLAPGASHFFALAIHMNEEAGNDYQGGQVNFDLTILATQDTVEYDSFNNRYDANAQYTEADKWDGTVDTSWYNITDTTFTLTSAEQFAGLALLTGTTDQFEGKTINLDVDVDLDGKSFAPIGTTGERDSRNRLITEAFKGTFDGNGKTISNLSQSGWDFGYEWGQYGSLGMFSELEGATIKNVVLEGFDCAVEGGDISFIAGSATGDCTFENIEIKSGSIGTYNNGIGGIIGWSGAGTYNFKDITIGEDVVIGGLWGSFDSSVGGIVGQAEPGATYNFENVDIACRLDVYNDCTASYDYYNYRMCGMIIGRLEETTTIDGKNYPDTSKYNINCTNVTVTYGDWANYHYCEPTPGLNNGRGMRVEPGYAYDGLPADYDHSQCVDNHMNLIPFDQIFGGAQNGVKGLPAYDGVTVIYNNK